MNAKHNAKAVADLSGVLSGKVSELQQELRWLQANTESILDRRREELQTYAALKKEYLYAVLTPAKYEQLEKVPVWTHAENALSEISYMILEDMREQARKNKTFRKAGYRKLITEGNNLQRKIVGGTFLTEYSEKAQYAKSCQWSHTYVSDALCFALIPSSTRQACMYRLEGMEKPAEFVGSEVEFLVHLEKQYNRNFLTAELLLSVRNAETLRAVREAIGVARFLSLLGAKVIHEQTDQYGKPMRLYECKVTVSIQRPDWRGGDRTSETVFQVLEVTDTSTDRIYHLYPTRNCETCEEAKRSTFNDHALSYRQGDVGLVELDENNHAIVLDQPLAES